MFSWPIYSTTTDFYLFSVNASNPIDAIDEAVKTMQWNADCENFYTIEQCEKNTQIMIHYYYNFPIVF